MKTELKAKFLQHLVNKKKDQGFTLIELLVVIIIIGILSAIALPSFLNQANKARQSEAQTYVGSINRGQQAEFLEENEFGTDLTSLELGIPAETDNYTYETGVDITSTGTNATVTSTADPTGTLKGYAGRVFVGNVATTGTEYSTLAVLCEGTAGAIPAVATVTIQSDCPE
ncbi:MAG: type IV pilin-like G/H family protein [Elainellaceae cyanobacterium]